MRAAARLFAVAAFLPLLTACPARQGAESSAGAEPIETARTLPPEWYADRDRNFIPDFIETQIGYNPSADDCPVQNSCGNGADGSALAVRSNILLILDSSGSMAAWLGGRRKIDAAKDSLSAFMTGLPAAARIGFMVYGHKGDNNPSGKNLSCPGIELLAPIGSVTPAGVGKLMERFEPRGWTPIAGSLRAASAAFAGRTGNRIILVSDGIETCDGDPVSLARELSEGGLDVRVDVVGFDVQSSDAAALRRIAEAGGGEYFNARTHNELEEYFRRQHAALNQSLVASNCEMDRNNEAMLCDRAMEIAAMTKMNEAAGALRDGGNHPAYLEAIAMRTRMSEHMSQRNAQRAAIRERADRLRQQANRTVRQTLDTGGQLKPQQP